MQFWNELEGQTIDALYPLRRLVRSEGRSAWFETETVEPRAGAATISLIEALTDADEVTARLEAAQRLNHPNLVSISKIGQARVDNTLLVYAVMEHIEQSLSDVLQGQALTADECREVAEALIASLGVIHQQGMSHGRVEPASVLATLETVKLRSDCLQMSPSGQADDVAGVGATLFQAFTQRKALAATDPQINRIPAPFAEIVRNSLARRWTLGQVANALKPSPLVSAGQAPAAQAPAAAPAKTAPPSAPSTPSITVELPASKPAAPAAAAASAAAAVKPAPPPAAQVKPASMPPAAAAAPPLRATAPPLTSAAPPIPPPAQPPAQALPPATPKKLPLALYAPLALIILGVIAWLIFRPKSAPAPAYSNPPQAAVPTPQPAPPAQTKPAPGRATAANRNPAPPPAQAVRAPSTGAIWHVVVYTYRFPKPAAEKAAQINASHADLGATVFIPRGSKGVYLLTVGGAMDHDEALKMLDKARRDGLPGDSFVRNYPQ